MRQPAQDSWSADRTSDPQRDMPTGWVPWLLVVIGVVALALRLPGLGRGLWVDEVATVVDYVPMALFAIPFDLTSQNNHVMYTISAKLSMAVFGDTGWAFRLPAALFGVGSVVALYAFARRLVPRWEALVAAAILATSYHHVWFSQNGRGYTALLFFTLLATGAALRLVAEAEEPEAGKGAIPQPVAWRTVTLYAIWLVLASLSHLTGAAMILIHGLAALWMAFRGRPARSVLWGCTIAALILGVLTLPALPGLIASFGGPEGPAPPGDTEWNSLGWMIRETLRVLTTGIPGGLVTVAAGGLVFLVGVYSLWSESPVALFVMLGPPAVLAVALVATSHNLWPRFFFFAAGFGILIVVRGIAWSIGAGKPSVRWRTSASLLAVGAVAGGLLVPRAWGPKQDFEGAAAFLDEQMGPTDEFVAVDLAGYGLVASGLRGGHWVKTLHELAAVENGSDMVWIAYTLPIRSQAAAPDLWTHLRRDYVERAVFYGTVGGGEVVVLQRSERSPGGKTS